MAVPKSIVIPKLEIWSEGGIQTISNLEVSTTSVRGGNFDATVYGGSLPVVLAVYMATYKRRESDEGAAEIFSQMNATIDETATQTEPPFYIKKGGTCDVYHADNIIGNHRYNNIKKMKDFVTALTGLPDLEELGDIVASSGLPLDMFRRIEYYNFNHIQFGLLEQYHPTSIGLSINVSSFKYRLMRLKH